MKYLLLLLLVSPVFAEDKSPVPIVFAVGAVEFIAPLTYADKNMTWGHLIELEGFSYALTDGLGRLFPKELWPVAPVVTGLLDTIYRLGEINKQNEYIVTHEYLADLTGILGRVTLQIGDSTTVEVSLKTVSLTLRRSL